MSQEKLVDKATQEIIKKLNCDSSSKQEISDIIANVVMETIKETNSTLKEAVNICCSADRDLAHKISDELALKENLLITRLKSMY